MQYDGDLRVKRLRRGSEVFNAVFCLFAKRRLFRKRGISG